MDSALDILNAFFCPHYPNLLEFLLIGSDFIISCMLPSFGGLYEAHTNCGKSAGVLHQAPVKVKVFSSSVEQ